MTAPARDPRTHRWPWRALGRDYVLAAAGFAVCFPPLLFVEWTLSVVTILGGLSALFAWLALRTLARQRARITIDATGIARDGRTVAWSELSAVTLRRYGARRSTKAVMEMTVAGAGRRIGLDSRISDFLPLARRVFAEARTHGAAMDDRTLAAFESLGLRR